MRAGNRRGTELCESLRSTSDAIAELLKKQATCCPPLANFAQLSMFRFDGVIKHHVDLLVNTVLIYFVDFILSC